ncbi:lipopolysaccharide biosynthesis protein [Niabella aurantiaca]|uniref:lipopolysaccharide biosynthesis protein n=1 Tax=Niabella aurantiaca TaxID=379900 RepID=UPI0003A7CB03|nr:lipopolysaccharide biosynthesis protein [Niabella aurantiaca]
MSLRNKTVSGLIWTVMDSMVLRGLSFLATILLARWLGPAQFGLIGMIAVFIAIGTNIADSGMSASLIRTKDAEEADYSTVFILNLVLSSTFYLLIFFAAPYIAAFYHQPIVTKLIRIYGLTFMISAFSAVQLAILESQMKFKQIMKQNMPGTLAGVFTGIFLGYLDCGAWSIIFMYLTTQLVQSAVLWWRSSWRPSFSYSKEKAKYHFGFGYKLMLSGLLNTIFQNIYNIVVGRLYTVKELGYFERSRAFNDYPVSIITTAMNRVSYPLLAGLQGDKQLISAVYRKIMRLTFFITCPLMFGAAAIARPLFHIVLGEQWLPAVPYFQVLCLASIFYPIHAFNLNVFKVYGRSELFLKLEIVKKSIIVIGLFASFRFGVIGLVWSSVICNYLALFINTYYSADMINYPSKQQFLDMLPTILISGLMFLLVYFTFRWQGASFSPLAQILSGITLCIFIYLGFNKLIHAEPLSYLVETIKRRKLR